MSCFNCGNRRSNPHGRNERLGSGYNRRDCNRRHDCRPRPCRAPGFCPGRDSSFPRFERPY